MASAAASDEVSSQNSSSSGSDRDQWDDWDGENDEQFQCLLCSQNFGAIDAWLGHQESEHSFDFRAALGRFASAGHQPNMYDVIRVINYTRTHLANKNLKGPEVEASLLKKEWLDEKYLKPVLENDALLFSYEAILGVEEAGDVEVVPPVIVVAEDPIALKSSASASTSANTELESVKNQEATEAAPKSSFGDREVDIDDGYFSSYASYYIHEDMLKDRVRTEAYRDFIYKNPQVFKDKIVMDVGCGTGILSMFAAKAGAKAVIAVDNSSIIDKAKIIVKENALDDRIFFARGKAESLPLLPNNIEKVDIIISEWMGYCLLYENMLPSVFLVRDRWLNPNGRVYPDVASLLVVGAHMPEYRQRRIAFWREDVYGFKMSTMAESVIKEAQVDVVDPACIVTKPAPLSEMNMETLKVESLADFTTKFEMEIDCAVDHLDCLVVYFDIGFQKGAENPIWFSTGPHSTPTHWKQTILILKDPLPVEKGTKVSGSIEFRQNRESFRDLDLYLTYSTSIAPTVYQQKFFVC